jgi:putative membrane protein
MSEQNGRHLLRGMLAGAGAGLAAAWVMNIFLAGPGQKLSQAVESDAEKTQQRLRQMQPTEDSEAQGDATMRAADAIVAAATGGRHLTMEEKRKGGPIVHYAFGAAMGGLYGGLAEYSETMKTGFGLGFGTALFAGADLLAVPALGLSAPLREFPLSSLASPWAAHMIYGATTELLRRALRSIL